MGAGDQGGKPHERLEAWRCAMDLVEVIYRTTAVFPVHEQYGLVSQMRRAAVSIPNNLAEGAAREGNREFSRFLSIARGSLSELDTQHQIAIRLGYIDSRAGQANQLLDRVGKLLSGLMKKLKETE